MFHIILEMFACITTQKMDEEMWDSQPQAEASGFSGLNPRLPPTASKDLVRCIAQKTAYFCFLCAFLLILHF
jgi:hypothetical protein